MRGKNVIDGSCASWGRRLNDYRDITTTIPAILLGHLYPLASSITRHRR